MTTQLEKALHLVLYLSLVILFDGVERSLLRLSLKQLEKFAALIFLPIFRVSIQRTQLNAGNPGPRL